MVKNRGKNRGDDNNRVDLAQYKKTNKHMTANSGGRCSPLFQVIRYIIISSHLIGSGNYLPIFLIANPPAASTRPSPAAIGAAPVLGSSGVGSGTSILSGAVG